ncbi:hypothetical protein PT974_01943 [Cladobotryum mycophilum]|uniref:Zn(2)-C6 fungal-type domain-containing protein n=1 Tax=Cladobotryum mycophilum TaxID=491253 RepID=A0ABR0SXZ3_9HYPO
MASSQDGVALRRLNGRLQACDPCRSRKVSCDHGQPVCRRCIKRNQDSECVYTPSTPRRSAPRMGAVRRVRLTSTDVRESCDAARPRPAPVLSRVHSRQASSIIPLESDSSTDVSSSGKSSEQTETPLSSNSARHPVVVSSRTSPVGEPSPVQAPTPFTQSTGYLGFTSYSSVFEEAKNSLLLLKGFQSWLPQVGHGGRRQLTEDVPGFLCSPTREMCLVVLRGIPLPSMGNITPKTSPHHTDGWQRVAASRVLSSLHERFGSYLGDCRVDSQLEEIAHFLSNNTAKPFREDEPDPEKWFGQFTGANLRWESVGMVFMYSELWYREEEKKQKGETGEVDVYVSRREWPEVARICLGLCIDLGRRFSSGNSLLLILCRRRTMVESIHLGDASLSCWRGAAECAALATFLGMHVELNDPSRRPTLASQVRRSLFAQIFTGDKDAVLFTGRPPFFGHRYVSTPMPLDINDLDLISGGEALERAVESLDDRGWNTVGGLYCSTVVRARYMIALIRDELVEVALGNGKQFPVEKLIELRSRELEIIEEFPVVQLEHLQNIFVVERLLLKRGGLEHDALLATSYELVSLTLLFWTHKDRLAAVRKDFEWLVMAFATPGGGILCMELLHPTFKGSHPTNPAITRSNIIQNLSLLIGFLDWIDPSAPNGDLCVSCRNIIRLVLDHVLNATAENTIWPPAALDDMQLDFNFELLDTFDWLRPDMLSNQGLGH